MLFLHDSFLYSHIQPHGRVFLMKDRKKVNDWTARVFIKWEFLLFPPYSHREYFSWTMKTLFGLCSNNIVACIVSLVSRLAVTMKRQRYGKVFPGQDSSSSGFQNRNMKIPNADLWMSPYSYHRNDHEGSESKWSNAFFLPKKKE